MEKNNKRGVTLVETVVAMVLVTIISVAIYMTCNFSIRKQNDNVIKNFFINETENIAMCYYHTDDTLNFENAFVFLSEKDNPKDYIEYSLDDNDNLTAITIYYTSDMKYLEKSLKDESSRFKIVIDFGESYKISSYTVNDKLIYSREV